MAKYESAFNNDTQRILIIFSVIALCISYMSSLSASQPSTTINLGPLLMSLISIPLCVGVGAIGLALTIKADQDKRAKAKKPTRISNSTKALILFYILVILMPFVFLYTIT